MPLVSRQAMASLIADIWAANRDKDREIVSYSPSPRKLPSAGLWMEVTGLPRAAGEEATRASS